MRFELLFVVAVGVLLPSLLALSLNLSAFLAAFDIQHTLPLMSGDTASNSIFGAAACAIATVVVLRRFRLYPGTPVAQSILPVLAVCYGVLLGAVILFRLEYSNAILALSFVGTLAARYAIESLYWNGRGPLYCVVPGGKVDRVRRLTSTPFLDLHEPRLESLPEGAIIADLHADLEPEWERLIAEAAISGRPVYHYRQVWEAETGRVQIHHLSENSFGALVPSLVYQKLKRTVDFAASLVLLPLVIPIMVVCAVLIRLDSPGPVFFLQRRMGFRGKVFNVVKFRTMTEANDGEDRAKSVTQADDQRITKIGRFLRKSRLDELPQIANILLGQMSWIGPRPEAVSLSTWYEAEIPFYRYRHIVRPGITGWAQVNQGHVASIGEVDHKLQYDFYYIKNLSYWLDIIIALRTLRVILSGFGAK
ncbi:MAG: exopolysaccharide biosynthesis polyprenyl glycosylphosphotransferase [Erythrobacter sp.]|nr:exopolysaccharide biosynthesis polyprenyl glycosylphosphotransferase [Erythrobacter sp.]